MARKCCFHCQIVSRKIAVAWIQFFTTGMMLDLYLTFNSRLVLRLANCSAMQPRKITRFLKLASWWIHSIWKCWFTAVFNNYPLYFAFVHCGCGHKLKMQPRIPKLRRIPFTSACLPWRTRLQRPYFYRIGAFHCLLSFIVCKTMSFLKKTLIPKWCKLIIWEAWRLPKNHYNEITKCSAFWIWNRSCDAFPTRLLNRVYKIWRCAHSYLSRHMWIFHLWIIALHWTCVWEIQMALVWRKQIKMYVLKLCQIWRAIGTMEKTSATSIGIF